MNKIIHERFKYENERLQHSCTLDELEQELT